MRYHQIRECDIANGEGIGCALFVQGCPGWGEKHEHCYNCFNPETWNFNGGKEWTEEIENKFLELANKPYIHRISVLGGEPLASENLNEVLNLANKIRFLFPDKNIWLYTGYIWEDIMNRIPSFDNVLTAHPLELGEENKWFIRQRIVDQCDVLVDGRYEDSLRDITLKWCGSKNQRVIDVKKSIQKGKIVLYE